MDKNYGQIAYEAYCEVKNSIHWKSETSYERRPWQELPQWEKDAWQVAAVAVRDTTIHELDRPGGDE